MQKNVLILQKKGWIMQKFKQLVKRCNSMHTSILLRILAFYSQNNHQFYQALHI